MNFVQFYNECVKKVNGEYVTNDEVLRTHGKLIFKERINERDTDYLLYSTENYYPVHINLLGLRSNTFFRILKKYKDEKSEENKDFFLILFIDDNCILSFLEYIYTGELTTKDLSTLISLLLLSERNREIPFKNYILEYIRKVVKKMKENDSKQFMKELLLHGWRFRFNAADEELCKLKLDLEENILFEEASRNCLDEFCDWLYLVYDTEDILKWVNASTEKYLEEENKKFRETARVTKLRVMNYIKYLEYFRGDRVEKHEFTVERFFCKGWFKNDGKSIKIKLSSPVFFN